MTNNMRGEDQTYHITETEVIRGVISSGDMLNGDKVHEGDELFWVLRSCYKHLNHLYSIENMRYCFRKFQAFQ